MPGSQEWEREKVSKVERLKERKIERAKERSEIKDMFSPWEGLHQTNERCC